MQAKALGMSLVLWDSLPPNDVSCSRSGSQVDLPPPTGLTRSKGICSSVGSSGLDSCSPNGSISMPAIFLFIY